METPAPLRTPAAPAAPPPRRDAGADSARWPAVLRLVLLAGCVLVPCVFATRVDEVFVIPKLTALWVLLCACLGVVAVGAAFESRSAWPSVRPGPADAAAAAFAGLNVIAWALSTDRAQSLLGETYQRQGLLTLLMYVAFFAVARFAVTDARGLRWLAAATAAGATLVAAYGLVQRASLDPVWEGYLPAGRVFSSIGEPNALAAYLVLAIPVTASLLAGRPAVRAAAGVALALMVPALLLTFSRSGYLGLLVSLPVLALGVLGPPVPWRRVAAAAAVVLAAVAVTVAAVPPARGVVSDAWTRAASSGDVDGDPSIRFRLDAWEVALHVAADNPLHGTGQETFPDVFPEYGHRVLPPERAAVLDRFRVESPHDVYLATAAGAGVPALLAYLAVVAAVATGLARAATATTDRRLRLLIAGILAGMAGHLVTDAFMSADLTTTWLFWVLMGAGLWTCTGARGVNLGRRPVEPRPRSADADIER